MKNKKHDSLFGYLSSDIICSSKLTHSRKTFRWTSIRTYFRAKWRLLFTIEFLISNVLMIHSTPVISLYSESTLTEMYRSNAIAELKKVPNIKNVQDLMKLNKTIILCASWLFTISYPTHLMNNCQLFTSEQCAWGLS